MKRASIVALIFALPIVAFAAQININNATAAQLDSLPGIGPTKAAAIIDYRTQHGVFTKIEDIQNVSGIGPVTYTKLKDMITVGATVVAEPVTLQAQPQATQTSYTRVQAAPITVDAVSQSEPVTNTTAAHEEAIRAPTAEDKPAAVGAVPVGQNSAGLFHSTWSYGLLGVILIAGGAFVLL